MLRLACIAGCLVALSVSHAAMGDATSDEVDARTLAWRALDLEARGRCREAVPLFRQAYTRVPVPTLALFEGRCLERMRQLVEAATRYEAAASFTPEASSPPALSKAVSEAKQRLAALHAKIPKIILENRAPDTPVWLDGRDAVGSTLAVNPGEHEIAWGSPPRTARVELSEGEHKRVSLKGISTRDAATYAALGVGVLGIGTGIVTGMMAREKSSDDGRALRRISTWSFVAGTVGLGVGGVMIVTRPTQREASIVARGTF